MKLKEIGGDIDSGIENEDKDRNSYGVISKGDCSVTESEDENEDAEDDFAYQEYIAD